MRADGTIIQRYIFADETRWVDGYIFAKACCFWVKQMGFVFQYALVGVHGSGIVATI